MLVLKSVNRFDSPGYKCRQPSFDLPEKPGLSKIAMGSSILGFRE